MKDDEVTLLIRDPRFARAVKAIVRQMVARDPAEDVLLYGEPDPLENMVTYVTAAESCGLTLTQVRNAVEWGYIDGACGMVDIRSLEAYMRRRVLGSNELDVQQFENDEKEQIAIAPPSGQAPKEWMTLDEAASLLNVGKSSVQNYVSWGYFQRTARGYVTRESVEAYRLKRETNKRARKMMA